MSGTPQKVSFTVRRPTPVSRAPSSGPESDSGSSFKVPSLPRHLTNLNDSNPGSPLARSTTSSPKPKDKAVVYYNEQDSSDEEDDNIQDELVSGFDQFGVQRVTPKKKPEGPLVIPALKNRDWRDLARKRRTTNQFVPTAGAAQTGADGSVGGLGTRDTINSGPVLVGLQTKKRKTDVEASVEVKEEERDTDVKMEVEEETEDQKALRAILAGVNGSEDNQRKIDVIPVSEDDAYKQDVVELPESATLNDYERVPVAQFGAALLRGMGWKEGTAASKKGKGPVEPYLPQARPALLGIGAKEKEVFDDGSRKKGGSKRPEKRYVPIVKKEKEGTPDSREARRDRDRDESSRRGDSSRRNSRSPSRRSDRHDYDRRSSHRDRDYDRERDRDDYRRSDRRESRRDRSAESSRRRRD